MRSSAVLTVYSDIKLSAMGSGQWTIVIQADNSDFAAQRKFMLTIGNPEKVVVTVSDDLAVEEAQHRLNPLSR